MKEQEPQPTQEGCSDLLADSLSQTAPQFELKGTQSYPKKYAPPAHEMHTGHSATPSVIQNS